MVISPSHSLIILFPAHNGNFTISDHLIPFAQWESHHLTLRSSYSLHTVVISPSHSLIFLFPSHSGNLTISLSDHLTPLRTRWEWSPSHCVKGIRWESDQWDGEILHCAKGIRWSESEMVRFPLCEGNKMIREWDGEITTVVKGI